METVCFEKDLLTGKILSHLHPEDKVHIRGFEEIENRPDNQFDIVSSNIPFGDVSVFDTAFSNSKDPTLRQASRTIHNYFFMKGLDTLREGINLNVYAKNPSMALMPQHLSPNAVCF